MLEFVGPDAADTWAALIGAQDGVYLPANGTEAEAVCANVLCCDVL